MLWHAAEMFVRRLLLARELRRCGEEMREREEREREGREREMRRREEEIDRRREDEAQKWVRRKV